MAVKVDRIMLRYFVPFGFECKDEKMFDNAVDMIKSKVGSEENKKSLQNDFYKNINELYNKDNPSGIGRHIAVKNDILPSLISKDKSHKADIEKAGIFLHRNGLGVFWYEVSPDESITENTDTLYEFQNSFKELAIYKNSFLWQKAEKRKFEFTSETGSKKIITDKNDIEELAKASGFETENKTLEKAVILENGKAFIEYSEFSEFHQGLWIYNLLKNLGGLHFIPERYKKETHEPIPDKALLCNYSLFSADSDDDRMDYIFRMTSGYNKNYSRVEDIDKNALRPFGNVWWYAKKEGIGQYVLIDDTEKNLDFHRRLALERMENYCLLYVLVLQQHYSLIEYSERIGKLSAVMKGRKQKDNLREMRKCSEDMNVFFMKNTFPAVSHISHQNDVYKYLKEIYQINEFYDETKNGLLAVTDMVEKYHSEKSSDRLFLYTIIGAFFVFAETFVNSATIVSMFGKESEGTALWWAGVLGIMGVSVVMAFVIWLIWKRCKK